MVMIPLRPSHRPDAAAIRARRTQACTLQGQSHNVSTGSGHQAPDRRIGAVGAVPRHARCDTHISQFCGPGSWTLQL
jgi:hypothetical protein